MELATSTVSHHCTGVREAAEAFNNKQDALYKDSARQLEDLRSELDLRLSSFQKENQTAVAKATAAINTKAEAMESVSALLTYYSLPFSRLCLRAVHHAPAPDDETSSAHSPFY